MDAARFDKFEGNDRGAFAAGSGAPYEADDAEADAIWAAVDARLDAKSAATRAAREEEEAKATAATNISGQVKMRNGKKEGEWCGLGWRERKETTHTHLSLSPPPFFQQFADLKRKLADVTEAEWEAIPEIGDYTIKKPRRETFVPAPDTLLAAAVAERAASTSVVGEDDAGGGSTLAGGSLTAIGEGRRTVVSLNLDR